MNLAELHAMRLKGYRPAVDIWVTDNRKVFDTMTVMGCTVIPVLGDEDFEDWKPIRGLPVVVIVDDTQAEQAIIHAKPKALWVTGFYGWLYTMREIASELCN